MAKETTEETSWLMVGHDKVAPIWYDLLWNILEGILTIICYPITVALGIVSFLFYHLVIKKGKELFQFAPKEYAYEYIFITGASSGIGRSIAVEFCKRFAKRTSQKQFTLTLSGRNSNALNEVKDECIKAIKESGHPEEDYQILIRICDVTDAEKLKEYLHEFDYDCVIANAAVTTFLLMEPGKKYTLLEQTKLEMKCWETNMTGCTNTLFPALERMIEETDKGNTKRRHLILTSSGTGYFPEIGLYPTVKSCLINLARNLRGRFDVSSKHKNIRVSVIVPGWVKTKMADAFPSKGMQVGMVNSEEAARLSCSGIEHDMEVIDLCGIYGILMRVALRFPYTFSSPIIRLLGGK